MIGESVSDPGFIYEHVDSISIDLDTFSISIKKFKLIPQFYILVYNKNLLNVSIHATNRIRDKVLLLSEINSIPILSATPTRLSIEYQTSLLTLNTIVTDCFALLLDYLKTCPNQVFLDGTLPCLSDKSLNHSAIKQDHLMRCFAASMQN